MLDTDQRTAPSVAQLAEQIDASGWFDIGYPGATDITYPELAQLLSGTRLINLGDPWDEGTIAHHTKPIEREVVNIIGDLLHAPSGRWGYVTTGASEGTECAIQEASRAYPGLVVYTSTAAHYSVPKLVRKYGLRLVQIRVNARDEMDVEDLRGELRLRRDWPALVIATAGTTWSEAIDDVAAIRRVCAELAITRLRIHVDAALAGVPLALLPDAERPAFDFSAGATSMVISGHKFLSTLTPCGVVVFDQPPAGSGRRVPYLATHDSTITGSRSGHTSVLLRQSLFKLGIDGHRQRAESARAVARHLHRELESLGWPARRNELGFTVVMRRPPYAVRQRWRLAYQRDEAHVVCMPGVTREQIDAFIADIGSESLQ